MTNVASIWLPFLLLLLSRAVTGRLAWDLNGKNVLITGGTKGIGKSIVEEFAEMGCSLIITCSRSEEDLLECQREWKELGLTNIKTIVADVSNPDGRNALLSFCKEEFKEKGMHVLVNNVGSNIRKPAIEYTSIDYEKIMSTNLESAFYLSIQSHDLLKTAAKNGHVGASVINLGSVAGGCGSAIRSGTIYAMTKAAMSQMCMNLGCEWAQDRIRVNCVSPWYISTPLAEQVLKNPEYLKSVLDRTPFKRVGTVSEVAAAVAFLAMDCSSYITGQNLAVDGGFLRCGFY